MFINNCYKKQYHPTASTLIHIILLFFLLSKYFGNALKYTIVFPKYDTSEVFHSIIVFLSFSLLSISLVLHKITFFTFCL